jgi:hypothetical protein
MDDSATNKKSLKGHWWGLTPLLWLYPLAIKAPNPSLFGYV